MPFAYHSGWVRIILWPNQSTIFFTMIRRNLLKWKLHAIYWSCTIKYIIISIISIKNRNFPCKIIFKEKSISNSDFSSSHYFQANALQRLWVKQKYSTLFSTISMTLEKLFKYCDPGFLSQNNNDNITLLIGLYKFINEMSSIT